MRPLKNVFTFIFWMAALYSANVGVAGTRLSIEVAHQDIANGFNAVITMTLSLVAMWWCADATPLTIIPAWWHKEKE